MYSASLPVNVQISRVSVAGCAQHGIFVGAGDSTVVESCTVRTMGGYGIVASTIKACSAVDCGSIGIYGEEVSDCRGESTSSGSGVYAFAARNSFGHSSSGTGIFAPVGGILVGCTGQGSSVGINAGFGCTVRDCTAINNTLAGISTSSGSTITGCTVQNNSGDGIQVGAECLVLNNTVSFNGTAGVAGHGGIHVTSHRNRIEGNHVTKNNYDGILIDTTATNNFILKNTSGYNLQFQYRINGATTDGLTGPNEFAPLQTLKNSTNSWANFQLQ
jgi:parallel beta-helix repeat protein